MSKFLKQFGFVALLLIIIVGIYGCSKNARKNAEMNKDGNKVNLEIIGKDNGIQEKINYNGSNIPRRVISLRAFAALKEDGSISVWGEKRRGGKGAPTDKGYINIFSNGCVIARRSC